MDLSDITFNYCALPNELKYQVIGWMERDDKITIKRCSRRENILAKMQREKCTELCYIDRDYNNFRLGRYEDDEDESYHKMGMLMEEKIFKSVMSMMDSFVVMACESMNQNDIFNDSIDSIRYFTKIENLILGYRLEFGTVLLMLKKALPGYLKKIEFNGTYSQEFCNELYELPQILQAETLIFSNDYLTDAKLLELNAEKITSLESNTMTPAGLNQFLKNRLPTLNVKNLDFEFSNIRLYEDIGTVCDGLDKISEERVFRDEHNHFEVTQIIATPYREFKLKLVYDPNSMTGTRISVDNV